MAKIPSNSPQSLIDIKERINGDLEGEVLVENGKTATVRSTVAGPGNTRVYDKRWFILGLFVFYSMSNAYQWIQYSIINNLVVYYYQVPSYMVNLTSIVYMAFYIPLIFPASWLLTKKGLRFCVIIGSLGTMTGAWVKCFSVGRSLFGVTLFGQSIVAISQVFILGIPPRLAAVWFGPTEVSTACAIGVFGNQLGVALGFLIPPVVVQNVHNVDYSNVTNTSSTEFNTTTTMSSNTDPDVDTIAHGLRILFYSCAGLCTLLFLLIIIFFKDKPELPPSPAAASALEQDDDNYGRSIKNLVSNKNYILLLISYGINVGVFYGISVLLNQTILNYFPGHEEDGGRIGLTIVLMGMLGSVVCGFLLDRTHRFKETTLGIYILAFVGMILYAFIFKTYVLELVYLAAGFLGFFMTGYLPVGFEFAAELTYPESEGTSSGLLNASAQVFGIIFTFGADVILSIVGSDVYANLVLSGTLLIGIVMTALIKTDLRRQRAQKVSGSDASTPDI